MRFNDARLSLAEAAQACGVSERTFRRWEADNRAPLAVLKLLRLLSGRLDVLDPAFNRFWIRNGRLFNDQFPDGLAAGDLLAANYTRQERDILRSEIGKLRAQLSAAPASAQGCTSYNQCTLVTRWYKYHAEQPPVQILHAVKRIPYWFGFSARASPKHAATQNHEKHETSAWHASASGGELHTPAVLLPPQIHKIGISQNHKVMPLCSEAHHTLHANEFAASASSARSRQACRYLPMLTAPATHGCVAPLSMDGRASLNPAPLVPPAVPLALLESVQSSASRPVSGSSPCADAQADAHKSGDIRPTNYLLCEVGFTATEGQPDDLSTVSPHAPDTISYTGCTSVTPGFNDTRTVYGLRFNDARLSLAEAAQACGVSERTFRRWEADNRAPLAVLKLLRLLSGRLDVLDPAFNRFWIRNGRLFNDQFPDGLAAGDLLAANYTRQERDILRTEISKLRAQLSAVPTPTVYYTPKAAGSSSTRLFSGFPEFPAQKHQKTNPVQILESVKRIPYWFGFSARAGPKMIATNNPVKRPRSSGAIDAHTGARVNSSPVYVISQNHKMVAVDTRPRADAGGSASLRAARGGIVSFTQYQPSSFSDRERQACRYLPMLTAPATHGCVAPLSMDGRASLNPAPLVPPAVPLALLESVQSSASRPVSGSSPCADAQADAHKSGDIRPTNYLLCEVWY